MGTEEQWAQRSSGHRGTEVIEEERAQRNSGHRGTVGTEGQRKRRNSGKVDTEEQWAQSTLYPLCLLSLCSSVPIVPVFPLCLLFLCASVPTVPLFLLFLYSSVHPVTLFQCSSVPTVPQAKFQDEEHAIGITKVTCQRGGECSA